MRYTLAYYIAAWSNKTYTSMILTKVMLIFAGITSVQSFISLDSGTVLTTIYFLCNLLMGHIS